MTQSLVVRSTDLSFQHRELEREIMGALQAHLRRSQFIGGEPVTKFESSFAAYLGVSHCVGVANGTDALEIGLEALGLPKGARVAVPANTFFATAEAVFRQGLEPIVCDVDETLNITVENLKEIQHLNPAAVIVVHLYGNPGPMNEIGAYCQSEGIALVEDCAQAHGASIGGKSVGSFGIFSSFSFFPGKNLGALGDGGAIVTQDSIFQERVRLLANHGRKEKDTHLFVGRNSRLDTIQASILGIKLRHLDEWTSTRQRNAKAYIERLQDSDFISTPVVNNGATSVWHQFVIRVGNGKRDELYRHLKSKGIESRIIYPHTIAEQPAFRNPLGSWKKAKSFSKEILCLPIAEHLELSQIERVCDEILKFGK